MLDVVIYARENSIENMYEKALFYSFSFLKISYTDKNGNRSYLDHSVDEFTRI